MVAKLGRRPNRLLKRLWERKNENMKENIVASAHRLAKEIQQKLYVMTELIRSVDKSPRMQRLGRITGRGEHETVGSVSEWNPR